MALELFGEYSFRLAGRKVLGLLEESLPSVSDSDLKGIEVV